MLDAISPYALLCACKPKPSSAQASPYDLYSQAQQTASSAAEREITPIQPEPVPEQPIQPSSQTRADYPSPRRTHYIAGIQSRHNAAVKKTPMDLGPMC